jgi:membrane-bound lytic murein transglycosylase MltF
VPTPREQLLTALNDGRGEIVAANLTITPDRLQKVDFTIPALKDVHEILVSGPSAPEMEGFEDLSGKELYIPEDQQHITNICWRSTTNSSHRSSNRLKLTAADENLRMKTFSKWSTPGYYPLTVVDGHVAQIWTKVFKSIKIRPDIVINDGGAIAAVIRQNSPLLKAKLDSFLKEKTVRDGFAS